MSPNTRYDDGFCRMFVGDAIDVLSQLPEKSVHCCVTSPPYFGLRSYLPQSHPEKAREGGTQETPGQYVSWLVDVFRGVWRVLRDDGTVWLNLGDSYAGYWGDKTALKEGRPSSADTNGWTKGFAMNDRPKFDKLKGSGLKPKDLMMIPARVALALQQDGWYLRSQIVWTKPNPMPESVTDRPTQATEMVYLLTKKPRYFYDAEAVKERFADERMGNPGRYKNTYSEIDGIPPHRRGTGGNGWNEDGGASGRNLRNYWQISTKPYPESHYAVFPQELPLRCIKAGTSEHGVCSECGAPWRRVVERPKYEPPIVEVGARNVYTRERTDSSAQHRRKLDGKSKEWRESAAGSRTIGFEPTCKHFEENYATRQQEGVCDRLVTRSGAVATTHSNSGADSIVPATVLDPFSGSGTTGLVARKLGRRSVLIDLDDRNVQLLEQRLGYQGVLL